VAAVRATIEQSRRLSERKNKNALRLSDRSVRKILHRDLKMQPFKTVIAQEQSERHCETRTTLRREIFQNVLRTAVLLLRTRHISTFQSSQ
jgi:hypothetical protein